MPIPKFAFSLSLVAFLLPFLLVTCNNTKTKELKPLVMQDQLVYTIQGYKILTNTFDKSGKSGEGSESSSLFGNKYKDDLFSSDDSEFSYEEKANMKYEGMRILLIVAFVLVLVGLIFQFFLKHESVREKASVIISSITILLLVSFYIFMEILINSSQNKIEDKLGDEAYSFMSSLSNIQPEIGLGSGFYLCILGQAIVLYYYLFFIKRYSIIRNSEPTISYETQTDLPGSNTNAS
jgi:hypothetical protein